MKMLIYTDGIPELHMFFQISPYMSFGYNFVIQQRYGHPPATVLLFNKNMATHRPRFCYLTKIWPPTGHGFVI